MDTESSPDNEQNSTIHTFIPKRLLFTLPVATLEARFEQISTSLEQIFNAMSHSAKVASPSEAQASRILDLERHFTQEWKALTSTVDAISSYAELASYQEARFNQLALVTREAIALVQPVTTNNAITAEWLAQRDAFTAHIRMLIDDQGSLPKAKGKNRAEEKK